MKGRFKLSESWWNSLTEKERLKCREIYEEIRQENFTKRFPYPHMVDTTNSKISKLTGNQIYCIFRFLSSSEWKYHWNYDDKQRNLNKFDEIYFK